MAFQLSSSGAALMYVTGRPHAGGLFVCAVDGEQKGPEGESSVLQQAAALLRGAGKSLRRQ
jgi:hypothetical protein